jgi:anti-anti-sigma factor
VRDRPAFNVEVGADRDGAVATVTVTGDIDLASVGRLERARERALSPNPGLLVVDLRRVRFIDSSGLKFLIETDRLARSGGWELKVRRPSEAAMRPFVVTGVDKHLPFVD